MKNEELWDPTLHPPRQPGREKDEIPKFGILNFEE
jgi:hypothetical protein